MPLSPQDIARLLARHLSDELTEAEAVELRAWSAQSRKHRAVTEELGDDEHIRLLMERRTEDVQHDVKNRLLATIQSLIAAENDNEEPVYRTATPPVHRVHFLKRSWWKYAAAIIIMIGSVAYLWNTRQKENPSFVRTNRSVPVNNDVPAPKLNRATLTLANGQTIFVDSAASGTLAVQGNVTIEKKDNGEITYDGDAVNGAMQYNTLSVPRGSQIASIVLSDGSKVYLNAASSLRYPVAFRGNERRVEITGEAYFEVARDATRKFIVSSGDIETEVLGTHFNVDAYPDEEAMRVTLLEGSVNVKRGSSSMLIEPGDQVVSGDGALNKTSEVNLKQVVAWKDGRFLSGAQDVDIHTFMRQVSRWYDVDVRYNGDINSTVGGTLSRQVNVSKVLEMLAMTGSARYKIEGKTVILSPAK
jgi:ferric-dicitrate binding protein FerR (iron transport regulator)